MVARKIKFRIWDSKLKNWIYPFTLQDIFQEVLPRVLYKDSIREEEWWQENYLINQYTGLKDKNGKEIYEGDIVLMQAFLPHLPQWKYIVKFEEWGYNYGYKIEAQHGEIIGNIYENPELIGE